MSDITPITNLLGDLDTYADELDGEGCHNAANGCRAAKAKIERLEAALREAQDLLSDGPGGPRRITALEVIHAALEGK